MSEEVIKELIKTGVISQDIADEARVKADKTLHACAFALHTLMCNKEHEQSVEMMLQPTTKKCNWYMEDTLELSWDAPDHNFWLTKTVEVMREQEIEDTEAMRVFLKHMTSAIKEIREEIKWYPNSLRFLEEVLKA